MTKKRPNDDADQAIGPQGPGPADDVNSLELTDTIPLDSLGPRFEDFATSASVDLRDIKQAAYGKLLQAIPIPVLFIDKSRSIVFANQALGKISERYTSLVGAQFSKLFSEPSDLRVGEEALESVFQARKPRVFEGVLQIGGNRIWGRTHLRSIRLREQQLALALVEDLTSEKRRLILSEKYRKLIDLLPIGIVEFALPKFISLGTPEDQALAMILRGRAVDGNAEFARLHGLASISDLMGAGPADFFPCSGQNRALYRAWIKGGFASTSSETKEETAPGIYRHLDNTLIAITDAGRLVGFWLAKRDITARLNTRDEMLRAQKLESLGMLAGGIAHDFNNILTVILGNVSMAKSVSEPDHMVYQRLDEAEKAVQRAKDLTSQLLTFSKGGKPIKKICSMEAILKQATGFALMGSKVSLDLAVQVDLWAVEVDEGQMGQVISNVALNAAQAMPDGGRLAVSAENVAVNDNAELPLPLGDYVRVKISDNGIGIPENYLQRVFDPYFTTKRKGSGLGLATSYSIVKNHGGFITLESHPGKGTTVILYVPSTAGPPPPDQPGEVRLRRSTGNILVMDDEESIRETTAAILTELGYEVTLAADGAEAISAYRRALEENRRFTAVIMDLTVPGALGGKEAIRELLAMDPGVRAIVSSGYSTDPVMNSFAEHGFKAVMAKPYGATELQSVLASLTS